MIPIYKPLISKYKTSAIKSIDDEWISNHGIYIDLASKKLCEILNIKYCVLMNNGTSATHCLYKALKFKYPQINKIYIPNNVFVAPWNCGILEYPQDIFEVMKINPKTMNIDTSEKYILSLEQNSCVVIVHNLGNIVNIPRLKELRPDLVFIEDNCEGLFGKYNNKFTGGESLCSAISFYGNKTITTGEGGAFLTNDIDIYNFIKNFYSHGMSEERYIHNNFGFNYRMTNVQAAFLYEQLLDYQYIVSTKKNIFTNYDTLLKNLNNKNIQFLEKEDNTEISYWIYPIIINNINFKDLENFMDLKNIQIRPFFYDIHIHKHLKNIKKYQHDDFTFNITNNGIMLPSYPELTFEQQKYIVLSIEEYVNKNNIQ
jgi:perosamine synthetase